MISPHEYRAAAKELGRRLGVIANEKGISQKSISSVTGVPATTINRIFKGSFPAKSEYLCCIAAAVGVDIIFSDCD